MSQRDGEAAELHAIESERHLAQALRLVHLGGWYIDLATGEVNWTEANYEVLGLPRHYGPLAPDDFLALVHPEDRARVLSRRAALFSSLGPATVEFRLLTPGGLRYIRSIAEAVLDDHGVLAGIAGTNLDITDIREAQLVREAQEERLRRHLEMIARLACESGAVNGDLAGYLPLLCRSAKDALDSSSCQFWRLRGDFHAELSQLSSQSEAALKPLGLSLRLQAPQLLALLQSGEPAQSSSPQEDPRLSALAGLYPAELGLRSVLLAPVHVDGRLEGFLCCLQYWQRREWDLEEQRFVQSLSVLAANSIGITTRQRATQRLSESELRYRNLAELYETANRQLSELAAMREKLVNMIVHDLRTPLSSMSIALEAMGDPPRPEAVDGLTWRLTREQVDYGFELCNQLLEIRRMQEARLPLEVCRSEVEPSLRKAMASVSALAEVRGISIVTNIGSGDFSTDHRLLSRILLNLLSNALRFSPRDSRIEIDASYDTKSLELSVRDHGPGISPQRQEQIFEMFATEEGKAASSGIGLAYCRLACEAMGGSIAVRSAPGRGSLFTVELPWLETGAAIQSEPSSADTAPS